MNFMSYKIYGVNATLKSVRCEIYEVRPVKSHRVNRA